MLSRVRTSFSLSNLLPFVLQLEVDLMFPTIEKFEMPEIADFFKKKKDKRKEKEVETEKEQVEVEE